MEEINKIYSAPNKIAGNNIDTYIRSFNFIFKDNQKNRKNIVLDFSKIIDSDMLGVLITYKFLEYSLINHCFFNPSHNIKRSPNLKRNIAKYGFSKLIGQLTKGGSIGIEDYKSLEAKNDSACIITPIALIRSHKNYYGKEMKEKYEPIITDYYKNKPKVINMILNVFGEIVNNFWAHAQDDNSIIVGYGNCNTFEIACADNGDGIDGTMRKSFPHLTNKKALEKAMEQHVTSKPNTNHMGYGLWMVNQIVREIGGKLVIYSNDICYTNLGGKIKIQSSPTWEGTIIYLKLPLSNPISISEINKNKDYSKLKINFV